MPSCTMRTLPFSTPCDDMLTMLVCATHWLYMHLYTLVYISMHEFCLLMCRPCFNTMKSCTIDPNLHLSLVDATFLCVLLLVCLFVYLFTSLLVCLPCLYVPPVGFIRIFTRLLTCPCMSLAC